MAGRQVSKESLRAMAELSGLDLDDDKLEALLPQIQGIVDGLGDLDVLNLGNIEPAVVFHVEEE